MAPIRTGDARVDRAQADSAAKVNQLIRGPFAQAIVLEVDLVAGLNRIGHGLGVPVAHFLPTALPALGVELANAQSENPMPQLQVWIRMAGTPSCRALIFLLPTVN